MTEHEKGERLIQWLRRFSIAGSVLLVLCVGGELVRTHSSPGYFAAGALYVVFLTVVLVLMFRL